MDELLLGSGDIETIDPAITCVSEFLEYIFALRRPAGTTTRCYRGQANVLWDLKPSVMRDLKENAESQIFSELMLEAPSEFGSDRSMFDKLVRAQHYGLPTRLLDVSLNPLVALYFACVSDPKDDGAIFVFDFKDYRVKFADSDAVSLVCNLSRLSDGEREEIDEQYGRVKRWVRGEKEKFRDMDEVRRLTQFVRVEKPYFLDAVNPSDLFKYFMVYPAKNNRRLIAQSGAFVAAGMLRYLSPAESVGMKVKKILIGHRWKGDIEKELDVLNINSRSLFPEVETASQYIKKKWTK